MPSIIYSLHLLLLIILMIVLGCTIGPSVEGSKNVRCIKREALALVDFKESLAPTSVRYNKILSWNISEEDCCAWGGITCDNHTGHVVSLDLTFEFLKSNQLRPSLLELHHLRRLDLSWNAFTMRIPEFIGSFSKLTYLDLSHAGFFGKVPPHLGNLSSLQTLLLKSQDNSLLYSDNFKWISRLSSLEMLDMSYVNFNGARDWLSTIGMLPLLSSYNCSSCSLPLPSFSPINHVNKSTNIEILDLSYNILSSSISSWFMNNSRNLLELYLSYMNTDGPFPDLFQNMVSLRTLQLSGNHIEQETLESIGKLCSLKELVVSNCGLNQSLTHILETMKNCSSTSLETLNLSSNNLKGTFPSMMKFPSLRWLDLSSNQLDSFSTQDSSLLPKLRTLDISSNFFTSLSEILRHLAHIPKTLKGLYLSFNSFSDVISDSQVSNFTKLKLLDLSYNPNLTLNFSKPPFQLEYIGLRSCGLGPNFPNWLLTQKNFSWLDISQSMIRGSIPVMFWKNLPSSLRYLNLSLNNFHDTVPNLHFPFAFDSTIVDLSSNAFYGPIPFFLFSSKELLPSNNHFSYFAPFPYSSDSSTFLYKDQRCCTCIDLSNNLLSSTIPDWFWKFRRNAFAVSVANNRLSGTIPSLIGSLSQANFLSLGNNNFSGEIPLSLKNCSRLGLLDLSDNKLSGSIPDWIGENLINLIDLSLRSNNFSGNLPSTLCQLSSLEILDLSHNKLSGIIPSCVYNFTAMTSGPNFGFQILLLVEAHSLFRQRMEAFFSYSFFNWKGKERDFEKNLPMVTSMDLSNNDLSGEIPVGITSLVKLHSLNLASNNLSGTIPANMGAMKSLESLNLASNRLCGEIPLTLAEVTSLSELDLSHNNLSGQIPISTQLQSFNSSSYAGNVELCGMPLPIKCDGDGEQVPLTEATEKQHKWDMQSFYASSGTGFAFGFLAILGALSFFQFASAFADSILLATLSCVKKGRNLRFQ